MLFLIGTVVAFIIVLVGVLLIFKKLLEDDYY